jgi:hypothetical protein
LNQISVEWGLLPCSPPLRRVLQSAFAIWDLQTGPALGCFVGFLFGFPLQKQLRPALCTLHLQSAICSLTAEPCS